MLLSPLKSILQRIFPPFFSKNYPLQTFTYFIPSPPRRKFGYQEKTFDELVKKITSSGLHLVTILTQSIGHEETSGMWVILKLKPLTKEAAQRNLSQLLEPLLAPHLCSPSHSSAKEEVEKKKDDNLQDFHIELINSLEKHDNKRKGLSTGDQK